VAKKKELTFSEARERLDRIRTIGRCAEKHQVGFMVARLLSLREAPPADAADAAAVALTFLHTSRWREL